MIFLDRRNILGLLFGAAVISLFVFIVGLHDVMSVIAEIHGGYLILLLVILLVSLLLKGTVLYGLFYIADITVSYTRIVSIYIVTLAGKYILPAGYFALQPAIAYILSKDSYLETERVLSIITLSDSLTIIPYYTLGAGAFIVLSFRGSLPGSIESYILGSLVLLVLLLGAFSILWNRPDIVKKVSLYITGIFRKILSLSERTDGYIGGTSQIEQKIDNMYDTMSVVFEDPIELLFMFSLAHLSAVAVISLFMISGMAFSIGFSFSISIVIVVIGKVGSLVPSPGGVGGVEPIMIMTTHLLTGAPLAEATVLVLLYRIFSYWGVIFVGSGLSSVTKYSISS